jgi:single-strand DNA-binding protein
MINKVVLIGRLGKDPEVRSLENGATVARITVATSDAYKDKEGNWQEQTEWHDVVGWRDLANRMEKQLKKGSLVYIEGKLTHRKWEDKDGNTRYTTEVLANAVRSLEKREGTGGGYNPVPMPTEENFPTAQPPVSDDLPF